MEIEQELLAIKQRNKKVEMDKAWERSWTRRLAIAIMTYIIALIWLIVIKEQNAPLKAMVPVAGYLLSTLSLPAIKNNWVKKYDN